MYEPVPPIVFDDVVLDLAGRRLWRGGIEQPLEPKAFAVLALLVGSPGQVFTRDEILDAVWGHRHVTPGVLNRVMTLLRHALGEEASAPHYLHTLHGIGYRFDLQAPASLGAVESSSVPPINAPATGSVPPVDDAYQRRSTDHLPPRQPWRAARWLLLLLALLGFAGWRLWTHDASTASPPATMVPKRMMTATIVVIPLKPIGDAHGVRMIDEGLIEELIGSLARIEGRRVIARKSTRLAAAETRATMQRAQRLGITDSR